MIPSKIAFLTEMGFVGKVPANHPNMRTEFAWMHALDADHYNIHLFGSDKNLTGYDHVFIIFPKGKTFLSSEGSVLINGTNPVSELLRQDIVERIIGYNTLSVLPSEEQYCLYHHKQIDRQEKQNAYYDTI